MTKRLKDFLEEENINEENVFDKSYREFMFTLGTHISRMKKAVPTLKSDIDKLEDMVTKKMEIIFDKAEKIKQK